ncbi:MAG: streptomycin 6-kinase [Gaiellales bacterium]|jgi:streptomycin 6-kinase|nr:streptomycin 6-kinase [Gaiellales bacterium]
MVRIPDQLAENMPYWFGDRGREWLARLPQIVAECERRWEITVGPVFDEGGAVSWVAPATRLDGSQAVLKLFIPDVENRHEALGLLHYNGRGAVRLLDHDDGMLLLERARPGTSLWDVEDEDAANRIVAGLLAQLWRPAPVDSPHRTLERVAAEWLEEIPATWEALGGPFERALLDRALAALREFGPDQGEQVLLHQDLHGGNVLRAEREQWLAIDPKPLIGEREFDLASLLRDRRDSLAGDPGAGVRVRRRLDLLASVTGLDRERLRGWGIAHALAWGMDKTEADAEMVACARWLAEA